MLEAEPHFTKYSFERKATEMNNDIAITIEDALKREVHKILEQGEMPDLSSTLIATDNLGEIIEKLCILHIRMWFLEDRVAVATTDQEVADLKRKIDICFKQKRPQYLQAINRMIDAAIVNERSLVEDSVKIYKEKWANQE
jgi:hypothetical protein